MKRADSISAGKGVTPDQYNASKGVVATRGRSVDAHFGVPAGTYSLVDPEIAACQAVTKSGTACRAPKLKGQPLCVAHALQAEKLISDSNTNNRSGSQTDTSYNR